jgi:hypothetical protein
VAIEPRVLRKALLLMILNNSGLFWGLDMVRGLIEVLRDAGSLVYLLSFTLLLDPAIISPALPLL